MIDTNKYIRIGFFDDFKGYDTLLISADIYGLLELEATFLELSRGLEYFDFSTLRYLDRNYYISLKAYNDISNKGLHQKAANEFEWRATQYIWNQFRELTSVLVKADRSSHQYLDSENNYFNKEENYIDTQSLQVVLSLYEYSLDFWQEYFSQSNN